MKSFCKQFALTYYLLVSFSFLSAQQVSKKDSLYAFDLLSKAESFFSASNYDSALHYCDVAETYSKQAKFKKGIAWAMIERADIFIDQDELAKAEQLTPKIIELSKQVNDSLGIAVATLQTAQLKMYGKKINESLPIFESCINNYFSRHPGKYAALAYNDYGYAFGQNGDQEKNAAQLIQALKIYETIDKENYKELAVTLSNLSTVYYTLNNKEKAIEYAIRSLQYREKMGDFEKLSLSCCNISQLYVGIDNEQAEKYRQLCVKYAEQSRSEDRIMHSYITSSVIAGSQKNYSLSKEFELKAIAMLEKNGKDNAMLARRYIALAIASNYLKEDSSITISYFNQALNQSQALNNKYNLKDTYYYLTSFYKSHHDYEKALEYNNKYLLYKDSIISATTATNIAELEKKYETEKKDHEIELLNTDKKIKALQIAKQQALLAGDKLEALKKENEIELLSKDKEVQELKIASQSQDLEKQSLLAKNSEQQFRLAEKEKQLQLKELNTSKTTNEFLMAGLALLLIIGYTLFSRYKLQRKLKEQEALLAIRNNIAKDLHDDVGATLTNINILNELVKRHVPNNEKANEYLEKSREDIQHVSESINDIVWNINPTFDNADNLIVRMKRYAADMLDGKNIAFKIDFPQDAAGITINMEQRRDVYMIFKEAINNLTKYSAASTAVIKLQIDQHTLTITVNDNGKGFDTTTKTCGNGLQNMKHRTEKWNGIFSIKSSPGKGTAINIAIPMA